MPRASMGTAAANFAELPEPPSHPRAAATAADRVEVVIASAAANPSHGNQSKDDDESSQCHDRPDTTASCAAPPRSFDFELPVGAAGGRAMASAAGGSEGGLQRLWEGGLFEMGDHSDVTLQTACCPWRTFGRNMERSGFGTSWGQGGIFLLLLIGALSFYVVFACTGSPWYIYGTVSLILLVAMYAGHYRARIRRRFNIVGSEGDDTVSTIDDHLYHLACGCCSLCQEARTLKSNNVHNGVWHGRGDILVIGSQVVFAPDRPAGLALAGPRRLPSWRKLTSPTAADEPALPVSLGSGVDHAWSPQGSQVQTLPLMKH